MLPRMNGFEAARRIKQECSGEFLPIIMVSALRDQSSKLLGYRVGVDDFLSHPVDRIELGVRVAALLALRERHQMLTKRNEELAELQRFRDEMSSTVVHDLKNPLSVVLANLEYAIEELRQAGDAVDPDVRQSLVESQEAGRRLLRLLTNLADTARIEANRLETVARPTSRRPDPVSRSPTQRRVMATTREIRIEVRGARRSRPPRRRPGHARHRKHRRQRAPLHAVGRHHRLTATRDGRRLRDRRRPTTARASPTKRATPSSKNTASPASHSGRMNLGLGLYFCRLAAEAHGGDAAAARESGAADEFVFRLPLHRARNAAHAHAAAQRRRARRASFRTRRSIEPRRATRLLLGDDDELHRVRRDRQRDLARGHRVVGRRRRRARLRPPGTLSPSLRRRSSAAPAAPRAPPCPC